MTCWSSDGRGEPELGPLEVAWESSVRSGRDPNVVIDVARPWGFGLRCFGGGGSLPLSTVAPAPSTVVDASGTEPALRGRGSSSFFMSGRFSGSNYGGGTGGNLPTSLIAPISHLVRFGRVERKEIWCFTEHRG
jgi:hypothetical protein